MDHICDGGAAGEGGRVGPPLGPEDVAFAKELAARAALAVDNARLFRETNAANRMKDEFLATVSHELRTPLTAMLGWARMLRRGGLDAKETRRALENHRAQREGASSIGR